MIVVRELTTNRITRIIENNHECKVDKTYNPNSDSDVQQIKQEWPDKKERKIDYIRYAATIDNICISVLVTEMIIEFITDLSCCFLSAHQ
jgi:hypothetical protein